jgi:enoyl-CoA hydratase/carnithine racemase
VAPDLVRVERRGPAAILTIDRPDRMNALSRDTLISFGRIEQELAGDTALRAIVVTGTGDRAFCAGADLKERQTMSDDAVREQLGLYRSELAWLDQSPLPVVAAINGAALGGGLELALLCDLRVATPGAVLGFPETSLGIIPAAGGTQRLSRMFGEARAKELILLGRRISASEALATGLVHRVSPPNVAVLDDALEWIEPILSGAPIAQRAALAAIDGAGDRTLAEGLAFEAALYEQCLLSEDRREALAASKERRKPKFTGR